MVAVGDRDCQQIPTAASRPTPDGINHICIPLLFASTEALATLDGSYVVVTARPELTDRLLKNRGQVTP